MAALLAPAVYLGELGGILAYIAKFSYQLSAFFEKVGHFEIGPDWSLWRVATDLLCSEGSITQFLCYDILFSIVGNGTDEKDPANLTKYFTYIPTGVSTKQILSLGLAKLNPGYFRQYDYGTVKNLVVYKSLNPPEYPIQKTNISIAIFQGLNDALVKTPDIDLLVKKLPNVIYREIITKKKLNHLDLIYGSDMRELAYLKIVELFETTRKNATSNSTQKQSKAGNFFNLF